MFSRITMDLFVQESATLVELICVQISMGIFQAIRLSSTSFPGSGKMKDPGNEVGLFYSIPCHFIPCHSIPFHPILFHSIPFYSIPSHPIPSHSIPFHPILFHSIPFYSIPSHLILSHPISFYSIPFYSMIQFYSWTHQREEIVLAPAPYPRICSFSG